MNPSVSTLTRIRLAFVLAVVGCGLVKMRACPDTCLDPAHPKVAVAAAGLGPKWDRYVEYLHRMAGQLQVDCGEQINPGVAPRPAGKEVMGWVTVNRKGEVTEILDLEGPVALVDPVRRTLIAAMESHHSYGIWTEDMAHDLGDERQVAMGFYFPGIAVPVALPVQS